MNQDGFDGKNSLFGHLHMLRRFPFVDAFLGFGLISLYCMARNTSNHFHSFSISHFYSIFSGFSLLLMEIVGEDVAFARSFPEDVFLARKRGSWLENDILQAL